MNEMFLLKLGEIVLKGGNRFQFENRLKTNVARRMRPFGDFRVSIVQSTVYVEPVSYTHLDVYKRQVRKPSKKLMNGTRPLMADRCATGARSMTSCGLVSQSMAKPV